jgi:hypothetical protein
VATGLKQESRFFEEVKKASPSLSEKTPEPILQKWKTIPNVWVLIKLGE